MSPDTAKEKGMRRSSSVFFLSLLLGLGAASPLPAQENPVAFFPGGHVFAPLTGDPREPKNSIAFTPDFNRFDYSLGGTLDLARWKVSGGSFWAWGVLGSGNLDISRYAHKFLDQSFQMNDIDLWLGTYAAESSGPFSNRLEYLHESSHLGEPYFGDTSHPAVNMRNGLRFTDSFQPSESFRLYGGLGGWLYAVPQAPPLYVHLGTEIDTGYSGWGSGRVRGFFAYDLKVGEEAVGVADQNFQLGVQWKHPGGGFPGLRLAVLYYTGSDPYGQFSGQKEDHWTFGLFVDP